jgi:hypothetical protein
MTHTPEEIEALVKALELLNLKDGARENKKVVSVPSYIMDKIREALTPFLPKEEWEYTLPEFYELPLQTRHRILDTNLTKYVSDAKAYYDHIRQLPRVKKKPEGREWYIILRKNGLPEVAAYGFGQMENNDATEIVHVREVPK